jgi:hypothetical protein
MNPAELNDMLHAAAADLYEAHRLLEERVRSSATADKAWRLARAKAYARTSGTVNERDAEVELETGDLRYEAKLTEDLRVAGLEGVRSRRAILSAYQTLTNLSREEANFARVGPDLPEMGQPEYAQRGARR